MQHAGRCEECSRRYAQELHLRPDCNTGHNWVNAAAWRQSIRCCAFVGPRVFFLKRKRGEICIGARLPFPAKMSSTSRPGFGLLLRETRQHRQPEHTIQRCSDNCASFRLRRCLPRLGAFYPQTTNSLSFIHHDVLPKAPGQAWTRSWRAN